jgi:tetratricopeptide (TPR) repeat protein
MNQFHQRRGFLYRKLAADGNITAESRRELLELALTDFRRASDCHPMEPINHLNQASTLILLGRGADAEPHFRIAVKTQGNMEAMFNANHHYAEFLLAKAFWEQEIQDLPAAISTLQSAARHMDTALELTEGWSLGNSGFNLIINIRSALGQALEETGDFRRALEQYDIVTALRLGGSGHYLAGRMLGKRAVAAWGERRSEDALRLFIDAEARVAKANPLPQGITPGKRDEYLAYLRKTGRAGLIPAVRWGIVAELTPAN